MIASEWSLGSSKFLLDPTGILYWPEQRLMAVADLHLEKSTAFAARGLLLPPYDTSVSLGMLHDAMTRYNPETLLALGDSFHDNGGPGRLAPTEREKLAAITALAETIWIAGNHDPDLRQQVPGQHADEWRIGSFRFRHEPATDIPTGSFEFAGHLHPKARVRLRGQSISRSCFIGDARRLILPSFGAYTGGLDVSDPAIGNLFPNGAEIFMRGKERVYRFAI